jgi:nitrite reductase/ring-hydroxylating ferredoxin subunit
MPEPFAPTTPVSGPVGDVAADADGEWLCASDALAERGRAVVWDVTLWGRPARAFALRIDGAVVAYLNRCVHVPTEMDWQEGEFLDLDRRWIVCSIHGAHYEPASGRCAAGPCGRGRLTPIATTESAGRVCWYASADIRPLAFDDVDAAGPPLPPTPSPSPAPTDRTTPPAAPVSPDKVSR